MGKTMEKLKSSLRYIIENDMIDEDEMRLLVEMGEKKKYLKLHGRKVWKGSDGRYCTYVGGSSSERRLLKKKNLKDLESAIVCFYKETGDKHVLCDVFHEWVDSKLRYGEIKKQTYDRYICDYERFFKSSCISAVPISEIGEDALEGFIRISIRDMELTSKGWGNLRTLLYGVFRYGRKKKYTDFNIADFLGNLDLSKNVFRKVIHKHSEMVFNSQEIKMIEYYIASKEPSSINSCILLGFETGMRISELVALKKADIDFDNKIIDICRKEIRFKNQDGHYVYGIEEYTKGSAGFRCLIVTDKAVHLLRQAIQSNPDAEYIFNGEYTGSRIHGSQCTLKLRKICEHLGITVRSMHKARKTYASRLFNSGVDESLIIGQLGHTEITTTLRHYYFDNATSEEARDQIEKALSE